MSVPSILETRQAAQPNITPREWPVIRPRPALQSPPNQRASTPQICNKPPASVAVRPYLALQCAPNLHYPPRSRCNTPPVDTPVRLESCDTSQTALQYTTSQRCDTLPNCRRDVIPHAIGECNSCVTVWYVHHHSSVSRMVKHDPDSRFTMRQPIPIRIESDPVHKLM